MLQNMWARVFPANNNMVHQPPRILIEISTSSSTLSRSGSPPFTITLEARVDSSRPVTVDTFQTVLSRQSTALDYQGLTFADTRSGQLAKRRVIDVQYRVPDTLTAASDRVVEIPPKNETRPHTVQHTFQTPVPELGASKSKWFSDGPEVRAYAKDLVSIMSDQTVGLEIGKTYEIGLGNDMSQIFWWMPGTKAEVFARGSVGRRLQGPKLQLELVKTATFTVVE